MVTWPPPPPPFTHPRQHPRFELYASVELHAEQMTLILPARNISRGGVYLGADGHDLTGFPLGASLEIAIFDALGDAEQTLHVAAKVARHDEGGMALSFDVSGSAAARLEAMLAALAIPGPPATR